MKSYQLSLPGPTEYDPEVLRELSLPTLPHYGDVWLPTYRSIIALLKRIYQTTGSVYVIPGSGSSGLDAVFTSLGDKRGLILNNGTFGDRLKTIARRHFSHVVAIDKNPAEPFRAEEVDAELSRGGCDVLGVVHCETSTGMLNGLTELSEICRRRNVLFVVDAVSSLGAVPLPVDTLGIDFCVSASQKALGAPPGLATISVSDRAWDAMPPEDKIHGWYLNLRTWAFYEKEWADWHPYPVTLPVSLFLALKKAMEITMAEGLEKVWARHLCVSQALCRQLQALGVSLMVEDPAHRSPTVTAGVLPGGHESAALQEYLKENYGIMVAGGVGPLRKRIFRIGHMGYSAQPWLVNRAAAGIRQFLCGGESG